MDDTDRLLLDALQEDLPLVPRLYAAVGQRVRLREDEVIQRVKAAGNPPLFTEPQYESAALVAVAREKHFGKAAEACFVSQPTLSVAVRPKYRAMAPPTSKARPIMVLDDMGTLLDR